MAAILSPGIAPGSAFANLEDAELVRAMDEAMAAFAVLSVNAGQASTPGGKSMATGMNGCTQQLDTRDGLLALLSSAAPQATPVQPAVPAPASSHVTPPPTRSRATAGPGLSSAGGAEARAGAATPGSQQPTLSAAAKRSNRASGPSSVLQRQMQRYSLRRSNAAALQDVQASGVERSCAVGIAVAGTSARSSPVATARQPATASAAAPASASRASPVPLAQHASSPGSALGSSAPRPAAAPTSLAPSGSRPSLPAAPQHTVHPPADKPAAAMNTHSVITPMVSSSPAQAPPASRLGPSASSSPALLSRPPQQPPRASQSAITPARGSPAIPGASNNSSVARKPWSSPALLPPTQHQHAPRGVAALRQHATAAATTSPAAAAAPADGSSPGLRAPGAVATAGVRGSTMVAMPDGRDLATRLDALLLVEDLVKLLVSKAVEEAEARRAVAAGRAGGEGGMSLSPRWWGRRGGGAEGAAGLVVLELGDEEEEEEGDGPGTGRAGRLPACGCSVM